MHHGHHDEEGIGDATGWSAFLAGAVIGAGVALLLAPQSGRELLAQLRESANRAKDDLIEKGQEAWDTAVERERASYDKGEEAIRDAGQSAREFAQQGQEAVRGAGRAAKEFAKQAQT